jgi:hypothetical protein
MQQRMRQHVVSGGAGMNISTYGGATSPGDYNPNPHGGLSEPAPASTTDRRPGTTAGAPAPGRYSEAESWERWEPDRRHVYTGMDWAETGAAWAGAMGGLFGGFGGGLMKLPEGAGTGGRVAAVVGLTLVGIGTGALLGYVVDSLGG